MGDLAVPFRRTVMEMGTNKSSPRTKMLQGQSASSTKTERKVIEKNRRNQMKTLFSNLNSLLPKENAKEALPLPDQIDEAINYIKSLEARLKKSQEKKERLSSKKRSFSDYSNSCESTSTLKAPQLQIREVGSALQITLISGLDNQFLFCEMIRILQEENVEIVNASFSVAASSIFHVVHAQMRESDFMFGGAKVSERLNRLINGSTSEIELEPELWDFNDLNPETWGF
ncbi:hypothetical protein JCGZ_25773 [Jatropha curcas]|uniref:BHLH domain-containing protein n=1 Tax=Jatropha curcas TaxID=180498 RepID=A0A067JJH0_JATCU|nr:transcription factor bHLH162 [Jatropha curcas]KDP24116.1 hypothetical protein JCGZ_25773 [Jatropha curcas]